MSNSHQREKEIFGAALELGSLEEQRAFIKGACGSDESLRHAVEGLLEAYPQAEGFIPQRLADSADIPANIANDEKPGTLIGRYKLLQKIGEGGMGVVYMAEQEEPVRRRVALKIIKLGMDTKSVVARFEAERQALALMDHPNIAKVLDAGATDTGRPYFVMELVQGVPITEFCDKNSLPVEERIRLFIQVCQAIQSAHQKGIIHRDIKPTNILVTLNAGVPHPMVIDFGVAKATQQKLTEKTLFTNFATMIGTPAYMSPEQAEMSRMDVDTRSDIYGLGVLLYELLTGTTPFPEKRLRSVGYSEMQRIIMEEEPERPSTRLRQTKTLALGRDAPGRDAPPGRPPAPGRDIPPGRPPTLGRDAPPGRPPPSSAHQDKTRSVTRSSAPLSTDLDWIVMKCLEKDRSRRYETANGLTADLQRHLENEPVLARPPSAAYKFQKALRRNRTVFLAATVIAVVLAAAAGISTWQAVRANREARRALQAEALAKKRLSESEANATLAKERLAESEAISKFLTQVFQSPDPSRDGRTITVAETLGAAATKLETDLASQPAQRAKLEATLGLTYYALGLYREAIPLQEKVRDYYMAAYGPEHPDTLMAMHFLATSYERAFRWEEALNLREQVLALRRKTLGPEHPDTLMAMHTLSNSYDEAGRQDEALKLREQVVALRRKILGPEHLETLYAMENLTYSYEEAGRRDEALKLREQVLVLLRKLLGSEHPYTLTMMNDLAASYDEAGRQDEALKLCEQVLALRRKVLGPEHLDTLMAMGNLATCYDEAGRRDEALKLREQVLALCRKVLGPEHPRTLWAMLTLAYSYEEAGRRDEALKLREDVLAVRRKVLGPQHPDTLEAMNDLANSYMERGRQREAIALLEKSCELNPKDTLASLMLATFQTWFGQHADYEATRRRLVQQAVGTDQASTAERAAKAYCIRPSEDAALLTNALKLAQRSVELGKGDSALPWYQLALGMTEYRTGQYADAERSLTIAEQTAGNFEQIPHIARQFRAMTLFRLNRAEEARKLFGQAEAKMLPLPKDNNKPVVDGKPFDRDLLVMWLAYKEAKALIEGQPPEGKR